MAAPAAPARGRTGAAAAAGRLGGVAARPRVPFLLMCLGALVVAGLAATVAIDIRAFSYDEMLHKQSAVHYTSGLPGTLLNDLTARATSRLYPLLIMPFFAWFDADQAIPWARAFNTLLFASAAVPVYLLARTVMTSRWLAALAGLLAVATPWLAITTSLYTENAAYPIVVWAIWAMVRAVQDPRPAHDALALVFVALAICTRVHLFLLLPAYWIAIVLAPLLQGRARLGTAGAPAALVRRLRRGYPLSVAAAALGALVLLVLVATGEFGTRFSRVAGAYGEIQHRTRLSSDVGLAMLVEVIALGVGVGILPLIVTVGWFARVLPRPLHRAWPAALVFTTTTVVLFIGTAYIQGGYLGDRTEERYYLYVVPFLWVATLAALAGHGGFDRRRLGLAAAAVAVLYAAIAFATPLTPEWGFLTPASTTATHLVGQAVADLGLDGLSTRDAYLLLTAVGGVALALAWRRPRARWIVAVAVPAALQIALTTQVFAVARGDLGNVAARTDGDAAAQAWLDRRFADDVPVTWLNGASRVDPVPADAVERITLFWNDTLQRVATVSAVGLPQVANPLDTKPTTDHEVDQRTGVLSAGDLLGGPVVQVADSPALQLAGRPLARHEAHGLELLDLGPRPRARWFTEGLVRGGAVDPVKPARVAAYGRPGGAVALELTIVPPANAGLNLRIRVGDRERSVGAPASAQPEPIVVRLRSCLDARGAVRGTLTDESGTPAGGPAAALPKVKVRPIPGERAGC